MRAKNRNREYLARLVLSPDRQPGSRTTTLQGARREIGLPKSASCLGLFGTEVLRFY